MIEVIPDFEMPAVKFFVTAKEQDCTQTNSFETVPPGRALQPTSKWERRSAPLGKRVAGLCSLMDPDGAERRIVMTDEDTHA